MPAMTSSLVLRGRAGRTGAGARAAGAPPVLLEALQLVTPHEQLSPRAVWRQAARFDVPAHRHHANAEIFGRLLDGQQLSLPHAAKGSLSDYQNNTYCTCSDHITRSILEIRFFGGTGR